MPPSRILVRTSYLPSSSVEGSGKNPSATIVWPRQGRLTSPGVRMRPAAAPRGKYEDTSSPDKLLGAVNRLFENLDRQSVVWLRGSHLPQDVVSRMPAM